MLRALALALVGLVLAGCFSGPAAETPAAAVNATPVVAPSAVAVVHALGNASANVSRNATPVEEVGGVVPALFGIGHDANEPTLGVTKDGALFYAAITFKNDLVPVLPVTDILRSTDGAATWTDVTPRLAGPVRTHADTGDPYVYVDFATGRVFDIDQRLGSTCHSVTYSDDGGSTWTGDAATCVGAQGADHQTIVAAPMHALAPVAYPNLVMVCWNSDVGTSCSRSYDGGHAFVPTVPPFLQADGTPSCGLVGHLKASANGTIYLPQECDGVVRVARTDDDGQTWTVSAPGKYSVPDTGDPEYDPAVAVDAAGHVHVVWEDPDGQLWLASSRDKGATWTTPRNILPPTLTVGHLPALAAGAAGKLVVAYMGSDTKDGYRTPKDQQANESWHGYLALVDDALGDAPTVTTTRVNPYDDPLVHGACGPSFRCPGAYDFLDVVVDSDGRPWASFVDACSAKCAANPGAKNDQTMGFVGTLAQGPSLLTGAPLVPIHGAGHKG